MVHLWQILEVMSNMSFVRLMNRNIASRLVSFFYIAVSEDYNAICTRMRLKNRKGISNFLPLI